MQSVQDLATAVQRVVANVERVIVGKADAVAFSSDCGNLSWACAH